MARVHQLTIRSAIALAPCAFALAAPADDATTTTVQLLPADDFTPRDGREMPVAHWHVDAASAAGIIARFNARANPPVLDYEHQTLNSTDNGQPAPAAGWIKSLEWRDGLGLFAVVELTARAAQYIRAGEYRYVSPVFKYDANTGAVLAIEMAAITNRPALDGMQPMTLRAAAKFLQPNEDTRMSKLHAALIAALGLAQDTTEDATIAAMSARFAGLAGLRKSLDVADDAAPEALTAACTALKAKADGAASAADPAKYVPLTQFETVKTELAALTARQRSGEVTALVDAGLADGRLLPAQKDWATSLGTKDVAALTAYLETAQPIAALTTTQTAGKPPEKSEDNPHALTDDELAVCKATDISADDFAKSKTATATAQAA